MAYRITRTDDEIDAVLNRVSENVNDGKHAYPGMSYEDGVDAALRWVMGETDDGVFDEGAQDGWDNDTPDGEGDEEERDDEAPLHPEPGRGNF